MHGDTAILVVTHNPTDTGMKAFVQLTVSENTELIIVDNASRNPLHVSGERVILIKLKRNVGLAAALNLGVQLAARRGYRFVAVFDQDSLPCTNILQVFRSNYKAFQLQNPGGRFLLSASYTQPVGEQPHHTENFGIPCPEVGSDDWYEVELTTTSGLFIPIDVFDEIGGFAPDLYLDLVDYDFLARARFHGVKILRSTKPMMVHRVGTLVEKFFLGRRVLIIYHSNLKRYLLVGRNLVVFVRRHFLRNPALTARVVGRVVVRVVKVGMFCDQKAIWSFFKGLYVGVVNPDLPAYVLMRDQA